MLVRQDFFNFEFLAGALVAAALVVGILGSAGSAAAMGSVMIAPRDLAGFFGVTAFTFTSVAEASVAEGFTSFTGLAGAAFTGLAAAGFTVAFAGAGAFSAVLIALAGVFAGLDVSADLAGASFAGAVGVGVAA